VFALAAPPSLEVRTFDGLLAGLLKEAEAYRCPLIGGNVSRARQTSITITAQGSVLRGRALLRNTARLGDRIFVTGTLGGAALELARAAAGGRVRGVPIPRLRAGRALARRSDVGACIDISDGLLADLDHVLDRSRCSAKLDLACVPRPPRFEAACRRLGADPNWLATRGGEDYELLFTLRSRGPARRCAASGPAKPTVAVLSRLLGVAVTEIGKVVKRAPGRRIRAGWRHF
jgi:thiamine-monophosphate kinase